MTLFLEFGPPNAGKGEMEKLLTHTFGLIPLSTGDVCRLEKKQNSLLWRDADEHMKITKSTLWPTELLMKAMDLQFEQAMQKGEVVLDGFLRDNSQIKPLVRWTESHAIERVVAIDLIATDELCIHRAKQRDREDDKDIHARLQDFHNHAEPALAEFVSLGKAINVDRVTYNANKGDGDRTYFHNFVKGLGLMYGLTPSSTPSPYNVYALKKEMSGISIGGIFREDW